jgi:hypothetical protein
MRAFNISRNNPSTLTATVKFAIFVGIAGLAALSAAVAIRGAGNVAVLISVAAVGGALELAGPKLVPGSRFSASYLAILAAGVLSGPGAAAIVAASTILLVSVFRRRPFTRLAFNFGSLVCGAVVAGSVLAYAADRPLPTLAALAVIAVFGNYTVTTGLVLAMVAIDRGRDAAARIASAAVQLVPGYVVLGVATAVITGLAHEEPWAWPTLLGLAVAASLLLRQLAELAGELSRRQQPVQPAAKAA